MRQIRNGLRNVGTYKPQRNDSDNIHDDVATFPKNNCVQRYEGLWGTIREKRIDIRLDRLVLKYRSP
jgi:hypothetical protein